MPKPEMVKMETENKENQSPEDSMIVETKENLSTDAIASELNEPRWSVATYESVAFSGLTYQEALEWVEKLETQKISGICIITDEAAARISGKN